MERPAVLLGASVAAVLALGACGAGDEDAELDSPTTTEASASPETESPASSQSEAPAAADGTDVEACYDGECEILVTELPLEIPIDPELGFLEIAVSEFDGEVLTVTTTFTDGAEGWGRISLDGGGSFDELGFEMVTVIDGDPILSIHPIES